MTKLISQEAAIAAMAPMLRGMISRSDACDILRALPAAPAVKMKPLDVEGLIDIVLQEIHGPLWRSILSNEDCLNRVCADQSPESCICAPKIDRIENHARVLAKARILAALEGGDA